jgi:hypothetical protein
MDPKLVKEAFDALKAGDGDAALAILQGLLEAAAGAPADETPPADAAPVSDATAEDVSAEVAQLKAELKAERDAREVRELAERRALIGELVTLEAETPATAWEGKPEARKPCKRLATEPLADLASRVGILRARRPAVAPVAPPASGAFVLTAGEQRIHDALPADRRPAYIQARAARKGL